MNLHKLNISTTNAVNPNFNLHQFLTEENFNPLQRREGWPIPKNKVNQLLNQEWIDNMKRIGLEFSQLIVFYNTPNYTTDFAHIDSNKDRTPALFALNWTLQKNDTSTMHWYKTPTTKAIPGKNATNLLYFEYPKTELSEIEKGTISSEYLSLVNTSIPHDITTFDTERLVFTIRFYRGYFDFDLTWDNVVEHFRQYMQ